MKKISILMCLLMSVLLGNSQVCTTTGFDVCPPSGASTLSNFHNAVRIASTAPALSIGSKYKFDYAIPALNLDAIISIDTMVNAVMTGDAGVSSPNIDNDDITDETLGIGSQAGLFAPRIASDSALTCRSRRGFVQFTVRFYAHYTGNAEPITTAIPVSDLNFLDFDMDGHTVGSNGWFKETFYTKRITPTIPLNVFSSGTELSNGGFINEPPNSGWSFILGSTTERNAIARCAEVMGKSIYVSAQAAVTFRLGYDYKPPTPCTCNCISEGQPTRQYGAKFGCFSLPSSGPLPVSLVSLSANYHAGISTVSWSTVQEYNLLGYEIERSTDVSNFSTAGSVVSRNSSLSEEYSFTDNVTSIQSKYIYYRLRIIDQDNSTKYSTIVSVRTTDRKSSGISVTPNPATHNAQLHFTADNTSTASIVILNAAGQTVLRQAVQLLSGNNSININKLDQLTEGFYTVRLLTDREFYYSRFLIRK